MAGNLLTAVNRNDLTLRGLRMLGLSEREAVIYLELLIRPANHAQVSEATGINRTTLYRMVDKLEKRGLVIRRIDDRGKFLVAADPSTLEVDVVAQESQARHQRAVLDQVLPALESMRFGYEADFAVHTYEGVEGFKRMLWHELKATQDVLCIGFSTLEDLVLSTQYARRHRMLTVQAGYRVREMANPGVVPQDFATNRAFARLYEQRAISRTLLPINHLITTYNHTVATYHVRQESRIGLEIVSKPYAETIRSMFEHYWDMAGPP